jgi:hypothetical protein
VTMLVVCGKCPIRKLSELSDTELSELQLLVEIEFERRLTEKGSL